MNWIRSILYGLISGIAEFLPISSEAHMALARQIFGVETVEPVRDLLVHIAILLALLTACRNMIRSLQRDQEMAAKAGRSGKRRRSFRGLLDIRLVKTAAVPMLIGLLLLFVTRSLANNLVTISVFLIINGIILFVPDRMTTGNKDARSMTKLDSILMGLSGAMSVFPGISRIGTTSSMAVARGADRHQALNWALLLSIPALAVIIGFDVLSLFSQGAGAGLWQNFFGYILSAAAAFAGGYAGISLVRALTARGNLSGFAYYSWGAGLFLFILYLQV